MDDILVIQNENIEGLGVFEHLLKSDGYAIKTIHAKREKIPTKKYSALIILGAPESVNDNLEYLSNEIHLIQNYVECNLPVLGICLGSQLIAKAFGANVYSGTKKEIGFFHDLILENQNSSSLFTGFTNPFTVFHWHEETFVLPHGAMRLARSNSYPNQAFKIGTAVGLQFHIEVDDTMINLWLDKTKTLPANVKEKIRNDFEKNIPILKQNLNLFYRNFKREFLSTKV